MTDAKSKMGYPIDVLGFLWPARGERVVWSRRTDYRRRARCHHPFQTKPIIRVSSSKTWVRPKNKANQSQFEQSGAGTARAAQRDGDGDTGRDRLAGSRGGITMIGPRGLGGNFRCDTTGGLAGKRIRRAVAKGGLP